MLTFFRKHAAKVLIITVVFFALSIIIPVLIQNASRRGQRRTTQQALSEQGIAYINEKPINPFKYRQLVNQGVGRVIPPQQKSKADPRLIARIMYESLLQTVDHTLFLAEAKKNRVRVSRKEVNGELDKVKQSYKVDSTGELKELLKRNGYTLKMFKQMIKDEILVQKMVKNIQDEVKVTDADVLNKFKKVKARHILIRPEYQDIAGDRQEMLKEAEENALQQAKELKKRIEAGEDFGKLAKEFSADKVTAVKGGDVGWFETGQMVPEFEETAFSLPAGQISEPIKTVFGYHIINIEEIKQGEVPIDIDEKELKKQMLEQKKRIKMDNWYAHVLKNADVQVVDKTMLAFKHKVEGDYDKALREYRLLAANNPSDPMAHVFIGEVYELMGKFKNANDEYNKGLLKIRLNKSLDNPFIYLAIASLEMKRGNRSKALKQLKKAEELAGDNLSVYISMQRIYEEYGYKANAGRMSRKIDQVRELLTADLDSDLSKIVGDDKKPKIEETPLELPEVPQTVLPPIEKGVQ
ncbi:peptidylprolyl isomerase [Candidatus Margulisiibacteriota bacterium]